VVRLHWPNVQQTCATQISAWLVTSQKWPRWQTLEMRQCTPIAQMSSSGGVTARLPLWRKAYSGQLPTPRGRRRRAEADPDAAAGASASSRSGVPPRSTPLIIGLGIGAVQLHAAVGMPGRQAGCDDRFRRRAGSPQCGQSAASREPVRRSPEPGKAGPARVMAGPLWIWCAKTRFSLWHR
jgi:hypothetical protein